MSKNTENDPDFFNKVHLNDYESLDAAVAILKTLVIDVDDSYPKYVNEDMVRPFYTNERKRMMPLATLKNPLIRRIKAKIAIDEMEEWYGVMLGSLDNKRYDQEVDTVQGQSRLFLKNDGELKDFSHYGGNIGPSGSEMIPPDLELSHIRVKPNNWTNKETGEVREGWNGMFVESAEPIPVTELKTRLFSHAIEIEELDQSMKYQQVLLHGMIGMVSPVDRWIETDTLIPDLDKNGNKQFVKNPDGSPKLHPETGVKILKEKYKREKDGVGQPLKQCKSGSDATQWVFKVSLFNVDGESDNRVSVQFQHTKLGSSHILMQSADLVLEDAASLEVGGSEDPFTSLQNMWGGKEVVISGKIISANPYQDNMWYGINGTLIMDEELVNTPVPVKDKQGTPTEMPEIVGETYVPPDEVTYGHTDQPSIEPEPVIVPAIETTSTVPIPPISFDNNEVTLLDSAIVNSIALHGDDLDYEIFMSIKSGIPKKFLDPLQELEVRKAIDRIRKEHIAAKAANDTPKITESTDISTGKPSEKLTPDKLMEQIGAGDSDDIEVISDPDDTKVPSGHIRCQCGKVIAFGDVEKHICKQK